jgi:hypothetical protein
MSFLPNIKLAKILHDIISAVQVFHSIFRYEASGMNQLKSHISYLTSESLNRESSKRRRISWPPGTEDRTSTLAIPPPFPVLS